MTKPTTAKIITAVSVVVLAAAAYVVVYHPAPGTASEATKSYTLSTPTRTIDAGNGNVLKVFRVTIAPAGYSPSEIVVNQGDTVQLDVSAEGGRYDLNIPGLSTSIDVPNGGNRSASFQTGTKGEFPFSCRVYCPNGKEIAGKIIVL